MTDRAAPPSDGASPASDGTSPASEGASPPGDGDQPFDVVAVGNALVDVLAPATDADLESAGLVKGSMALVDHHRSASIYAAMGPTVEASGGSAANTAAGVAALGGRAAFLGRVADDAFGQVFVHDIRSVGVAFEPAAAPAAPAVPGKSVTGHCLVLVTGDAERTMATHLGVASDFGPVDLHAGHLAAAQVLYLEGYLWEQPSAKAAMREAIEVAHAHDTSVALSLSDPFCVAHHQREFLDLVRDDLDMVFANEDEIKILFGAADLDAAAGSLGEAGILGVVTRGPAGCVVVSPAGVEAVAAEPVERVVDTTGAGDLFAAGFLYGITHGLAPRDSARLGGICAGEVISHLGARPEADLGRMVVDTGLLS